jgi:hypothetical protein
MTCTIMFGLEPPTNYLNRTSYYRPSINAELPSSLFQNPGAAKKSLCRLSASQKCELQTYAVRLGLCVKIYDLHLLVRS